MSGCVPEEPESVSLATLEFSESAGRKKWHLALSYRKEGFITKLFLRGQDKMHLQTILNRVQRHKSFVYKKAAVVEKKGSVALEVQIQPRHNSRAICSGMAFRRSPRCGVLAPRGSRTNWWRRGSAWTWR